MSGTEIFLNIMAGLFLGGTVIMLTVAISVVVPWEEWLDKLIDTYYRRPKKALGKFFRFIFFIKEKPLHIYRYTMSDGSTWITKEQFDSMEDALDFGWHYALNRQKAEFNKIIPIMVETEPKEIE